MSPLTLLRLLAGIASACGLASAERPPSVGLEGAVEAPGDTGTLTLPTVLCAPTSPSSDGRASSAARTRNTISAGLTRSMSTVPPSLGRSVASPVAASYSTENGRAGMRCRRKQAGQSLTASRHG